MYKSFGCVEVGRIPGANKYDDGSYADNIFMIKRLRLWVFGTSYLKRQENSTIQRRYRLLSMHIMVDFATKETIRLKELMPKWWGKL